MRIDCKLIANRKRKRKEFALPLPIVNGVANSCHVSKTWSIENFRRKACDTSQEAASRCFSFPLSRVSLYLLLEDEFPQSSATLRLSACTWRSAGKALTRLSDLAINQGKWVKFDERWAGNDTGDLVTLATDLK